MIEKSPYINVDEGYLVKDCQTFIGWLQLTHVLNFQAHRLEDQRSEPPLHRQAPTVPDEDFFGLILRLQSNRMDDQRSSLPGNNKRYFQKWTSILVSLQH